MKENYVYPAKITCNENMYQITFLDFPDMSIVEEAAREDAIHSAQEYLAHEILSYEERNEKLPVPNESASDVIYIHIWMPYYRNAAKEVYVKKNVTIPQSLDILAKEHKVNYSAALVKGIKLALGIEH
ncbi:MAG: type II toxin-antitoxin system HicB family antitoxin [Lachnospiraceae bacterium]|nr:type II toxin-antitoxin system HicB family antitoxin [Lachnospiraceae bacterium]